LKKFGHLLAGLPTITHGQTNQPSWSISGAMRSVFPSAPVILVWSHWLQQSFEADAISGVTDSCSADGERVNNIYMRTGPSGPILSFLIHFEFYPTKRSRFEKKKSSPMFLEFDLVCLHNFSRFYIIFLKFQI
jgi:hypothetical protein